VLGVVVGRRDPARGRRTLGGVGAIVRKGRPRPTRCRRGAAAVDELRGPGLAPTLRSMESTSPQPEPLVNDHGRVLEPDGVLIPGG
jgi:hypothetical protein